MPPSILWYLTFAASAIAAVAALVLLLRGGAGSAAERSVREEARAARAEQASMARSLREELAQAGKANADTTLRLLTELSKGLDGKIERLREEVGKHLTSIQESNDRKLEEMRVTVDEKLHGTLERRLGESFAAVSERLEAVQRGLGEMQALASGVGDLKRVLTNVKTRGIWGESQLHAVLEQVLTPDQYCANYRPREDSADSVEFAIRLPGRDPSGDPIFLPLDSKFPQEDYLRLLDAVERADPDAAQEATAALVRRVRASAREISEKYLHPPATTDFAILFLPTEGLYAEVLRQPGLVQEIQRQYDVVIAGPTTLAALLSSLRMGFRTLAIERRSGEVWKILGAVKTEFGKFGEVLDRVKRQLHAATMTVENTGMRTRAIQRQLRQVEELPPDLSQAVLGLAGEEEVPST